MSTLKDRQAVRQINRLMDANTEAAVFGCFTEGDPDGGFICVRGDEPEMATLAAGVIMEIHKATGRPIGQLMNAVARQVLLIYELDQAGEMPEAPLAPFEELQG